MRHRLAWLFLAVALIAGSSSAFAQISLTDIAGRDVVLEKPASRILLEAPAYYPALSLLSDDAASLVIGVGGAASRGSTEADADLDGKPRLGTIASGTFSIENAISLRPDLLIVALDRSGQNAAVEAAFARVGVPIIYVDFYVDAAANSLPSMQIIGRAIGAKQRTDEFANFYRSRIDTIENRLAEAAATPQTVFIYRRANDGTCCWTFANGFISSYFGMLRIDNIAAGRLPGMLGQLSLEAVIESDPDVFIATDMSVGPTSMFAQGRSPADSAGMLEEIADQTGLSGLVSVRDGDMHALNINLMRSPLNILAVELMAKWAHPELFADLDPQATLDELNMRFLRTPLEGPFWVSLGLSADASTESGPSR